MSTKSTPQRYGTVAIAIHWVTATLIIALLALGLNAANASTDELRRTLVLPHIVLGIVALLFTLVRIVWWWRFDRKPEPVSGTPPLMARVAHISHLLIYALILALAVTGIATNVLGGVLDAIVSGAPIPPLNDLGPRQGHGNLARLFMVLLVIHVAAALYHHLIRRDATLARMVGKSG